MICRVSQKRGFRHPKIDAFGVICLALALLQGACGKPKPLTAADTVQTMANQASAAQACRGRAWVSVKSTVQKASFAGVVVLDRTDPRKARMRIEALDPVGGIHHLIVVDGAHDTLDWADFDNGVWRSGSHKWRGVAIRMLPHLLLGSVDPAILNEFGFTAPQVSSAEGAETVTLRQDGNVEPLILSLGWVSPGPHLLLQSVATKVSEGQGLRQVRVAYDRFGESKDKHAPRDVVLTVQPDFELKLLWREREWMDAAPANELFAVPEDRKAGMRRYALP